MVNCLVLEGRREARERMARLMAGAPMVARVEQAATPLELLSKLESSPAALVLLSARLPEEDLWETVREISLRGSAGIIVFGSPEWASSGAAAIFAGADGFFSWEAGAVRAAGHGSMGTPPVPSPRRALDEQPPLSRREIEVLRRMSLGMTNGEIGNEMHLSEDTIKTHAQRMFRKLRVSDRAHAVMQGFRQNLLD
ncbi:DNA-binding response regulator [Amycolatopsis thailandensis]|uniref:DNA-binding response regulator n=1 Tax=Amycolatopsis thailandensis TaxID=589330 RepID=A0A229SB14_9PSEU|nr:DNA-binding response regulator [Amycolatopsis thailandensis]